MSSHSTDPRPPQTGPKTAEGKIRSSQNAVTHSIFTRIENLSQELKAQYEQARQKMVRLFQPKNQPELDLVNQMGVLAWRIERVASYELDAEAYCEGNIEQLSKILSRLATYQTRLERLLEKSMALYRFLVTTRTECAQPASQTPSTDGVCRSSVALSQPPDILKSTLSSAKNIEKSKGLVDRFRQQFQDNRPTSS